MKIYQEAELAINEQFWPATNDPTCKFSIQDKLKERLEKDNAEKDPDYYQHRAGVVHTTSLAKCLRGVVLEMLGAKKDFQDPVQASRKLGVFKAGNLFEEYIANVIGSSLKSRQTEYIFQTGSIILTGRDDGIFEDEHGNQRLLEAKSVHSDSFWYREKEGILVAWQNQIQIQTYLWLRRTLPTVFYYRSGTEYAEEIYTNLTREELATFKGWAIAEIMELTEKPNHENLNGYFTYISKDDCTVVGAPVKYNPWFTSEIIMPVLNAINDGYTAKDPKMMRVPDAVILDKNKGQYVTNWLCAYCEFHCQCTHADWKAEASQDIKRKNAELKKSVVDTINRHN